MRVKNRRYNSDARSNDIRFIRKNVTRINFRSIIN
jgi:hypothetical protein